MRPSRDSLKILALALAAGLALSLFEVVPAHSQATPVLVRQAAQVPHDPLDAAWDAITPLNVPLSAQHITLPGGGNVFSVQVRSVHDGSRIAFQLSWSDASRNGAALRPGQFRDAAAIQLPVHPTVLPFYCMGQRTGSVNIWHWKADWQDDMDAFQDVQSAYPAGAFLTYPQSQESVFTTGRSAGNPLSLGGQSTPVENLVAGGFGTLTSVAEQSVQGKGVWQNGRWTVVFERDLLNAGPNDAPMPLGGTTAVAFAVWDGANNDRDGQKATSTWFTLELQGQARSGPISPTAGLLLFVGGGVVVIGGVWWALPGRRPEPAQQVE